jgi:2-polyprenyl-3-methyl-5-hydroxy-6-metoxy-1,4-benzoquinol methylase
MFIRPEDNYEIDDSVIEGILKDEAHPLCQIIKMMPNEVSILDIGAGSGVLGRVLKLAGKHVIIDGIEPNKFAANLAKPFYRNVYIGYAQDHFSSIKDTKYDYVVLADVIEHIPDPVDFLAKLRGVIPESTKFVVSIPNVAFGGVRLALMNGFFKYVDSGLLECTHLRFFTLASALELFKIVDLSPRRISYLERSFYRTEFSRYEISASLLNVLSLAIKSDARAYQYLFVLARASGEVALVEHHGAGAAKVLFDALFFRNKIKTVVRYLRGYL